MRSLPNFVALFVLFGACLCAQGFNTLPTTAHLTAGPTRKFIPCTTNGVVHTHTSKVRPLSARRGNGDDLGREQRERLEAEIKDPVTFYEFLLPRPVRKFAWVSVGGNCFLGGLVLAGRVAAGLQPADADSWAQVGAQFGVAALMGWFFKLELEGEAKRIARRKAVREAQVARSDRTRPDARNPLGKLKEVDGDWMVRRLERMCREDPALPMLGADKAAVLRELVRTNVTAPAPVLVDVGGFLGYSALQLAQALPAGGGTVISVEKSLQYGLIAKRFVAQAKMDGTVRVEVGDAREVLAALPEGRVDLLFLDAEPGEAAEYLAALGPRLGPGAVVVTNRADDPRAAAHVARLRGDKAGWLSYPLRCRAYHGGEDAMELSFALPAGEGGGGGGGAAAAAAEAAQ